MQFKYKGYTLVQSDLNNHYMILDSNDEMCMHAQCTKRLTDKEKIEVIERFIKLKNIDYAKAFENAISALEKQIPKKPTRHIVNAGKIKIGNGYWGKGTTVYKCPNCKEWVSKTYKHCPDCGQALDFNSNGSDNE